MSDKNYKEIVLPQVGVNEDSANLLEWVVDEGGEVVKGQHLCTIETTKTALEIESDYNGFLVHLVKPNTRVNVNNVIGLVLDDELNLKKVKNSYLDEIHFKKEKINKNFTKKALELIKLHNIDVNDLPENKLIRTKDILRLKRDIKSREKNFLDKRNLSNNSMIILPGWVKHGVKKVSIKDSDYYDGWGRYCISSFFCCANELMMETAGLN